MKAPALLRAVVTAGLLIPAFAPSLHAQQAYGSQAPATDASTPTFKTTVRRVVLDVVVTDANGNPVPGLKKEDFSITEGGKPQAVLSFEPYGFDQAMDYQPAKLPPVPVNTFVNLPTAPEKGPLYVLLYDLVNMDGNSTIASGQHGDQLWGRQQLVKFIQSKPEGARFAIFVWSDGLHLLQGFTSDKAQLFAAIDPHSSRPHIPEVFMMGENFGRGDVHSTIDILNYIGGYLDGMPGRKNLIWFSGGFPLSFFPTKNDGPNYVARVKATLNLLAQDQVAIYPVDVRGVVSSNSHSADSVQDGGDNASGNDTTSASGAQSTDTQADASKSAGTGGGQSLLNGSYMDMDEIARETGGRAFYSNNQVAAALTEATENGSSYYTLTYSPSDRNYDGKLRLIRVELAKKGYHLAYRHTYYAADNGEIAAVAQDKAPVAPDKQEDVNDTLYVNMKHGGPTAHQLIFGVHVHTLGPPAKGTPEQMAQLATQPAYLKAGRKNAVAKLAPISLQKFAIDYTVTTRQLHLQPGAMLNLQVAAAAYDNDGKLLNAVVNSTAEGAAIEPAAAQPSKPYRVEQQMDVPLAAASIRMAVRDVNSNRVGAMEIKLPLAPENESAAAADGKNPQKTN
jgi:VWFA-related protein